jgi:hypothetical protein
MGAVAAVCKAQPDFIVRTQSFPAARLTAKARHLGLLGLSGCCTNYSDRLGRDRASGPGLGLSLLHGAGLAVLAERAYEFSGYLVAANRRAPGMPDPQTAFTVAHAEKGSSI